TLCVKAWGMRTGRRRVGYPRVSDPSAYLMRAGGFSPAAGAWLSSWSSDREFRIRTARRLRAPSHRRDVRVHAARLAEAVRRPRRVRSQWRTGTTAFALRTGRRDRDLRRTIRAVRTVHQTRRVHHVRRNGRRLFPDARAARFLDHSESRRAAGGLLLLVPVLRRVRRRLLQPGHPVWTHTSSRVVRRRGPKSVAPASTSGKREA